jgi:hypothetical protein
MGIFTWLYALYGQRSKTSANHWHRRALAPTLRVRRLEERRVLNADAAPLTQLVIDAGEAASDGQADTFHVELQADHVRVSVNGRELSKTPVGQVESIMIRGSLDDDLLIAEFKAGEPLAGLELLFDGGRGDNSIRLAGDRPRDSVTHQFGDLGSGRIVVGTATDYSTVAYVGVQTIHDSIASENRTFQLETGGQQLKLNDFGDRDDGLSRISVGDALNKDRELVVVFHNPSESLHIKTGMEANRSADRVELAGLDRTFDAHLRVSAAGKDELTLNGQIDAKGGDVALVSGRVNIEDTLTTRGANLSIEATDQVFIGEQGRLRNDGGRIVVHAPSIELDGNVRASSGHVTLDAGEGGVAIVRGMVDVSATDDFSQAGTVHILGSRVGLFDNARVEASSVFGGGLVLIGGDYQGQNPAIRNAERTYVGPDAQIRADATLLGDGGKIVVWANEVTRFHGTISARGGSHGGNGGFAEVSAKEALVYRGFADLTSPKGARGTLLLDPKNIVIADGGADDINDNEFTEVPAQTRTFDADQVVAALAGANLELQANTDITVDEQIDARGNNNPGSLTLRAGRSVIINQSIFLEGDLIITADDPGAVAAQRDPGTALITIGGGGAAVTLDTSDVGGDITLNGPVVLAADNVTITTGSGAGNIQFGDTINADNAAANNRTLTITAGTGTVTFDGAIGSTQALADLDITAGTINLNNPTVTVNDQGGNTVTFTGAVVLGANVAINTDGAADNSLEFNTAASTINADNAAANNRTLTITAGTGTVTFDGAIGSTQALADLDITAGTINLNNPTVTVNDQGGNTVTFTGAVVLGANVAINTDGAADNSLEFNTAASTINADNAAANNRTLTITAGTGTVTFDGAIGGAVNGSLAELTTSGATISVGNATTSGNQSYTSTGLMSIGGALNSVAGNISVVGGTVNQNGNIMVSGGGVGNMSVTANVGNITMASGTASTTALGSITYLATNGNVLLSQLTSSMSGAVSVSATVGAILDNNGTVNNISTDGNLSLVAGTSIGTITSFAAANVGDDSGGAGNAIELVVGVNSISLVQAPVIHLVQSGALTIAAATIDIGGAATGQAILQTTGNLNAGAVNSIALTGDDSLALISQGSLTIPAAGFNSATTATPGDLRMIGLADVVASGGGNLIFRADDLFFRSGGAAGNTTLETNVASLTAQLDTNNLVVQETLSANNDIRLDQVLTLAGTVTVTTAAGGGGSIDVGLVEAANGTQTATLSADGAIRTLSDDSTADIRGSTIDLTARLGIGTAGMHLDVAASTVLHATTTIANTNIFIDGIGNLPVGLVSAGGGTGDVTLNSSGNISDANGSGSNNISAVNLSVAAASGVDLDTTVTNLTATTSGMGNIAVRESNGVNLVNVTAASGNVSISTTSGDLNVTTVNAVSNQVTLLAMAGAISDANGMATNITAGSLAATAETGITLDTTVSNITATTTGVGDILLRESDGANLLNISVASGNASISSASGNLNVSTVSALLNTVTLAAVGGAITDANGAALNISAANLLLTAGSGIGTAGDSLDTNVSVFAGNSGTGGLFLSNQQALDINVVGATAGATAAGNILIETSSAIANSNLNVLQPVISSGGSISLLATNPTSDVHFNAAVSANQNVTSAAGRHLVVLQPVNAVNGFATLSAGGNATLNAPITAAQNISATAAIDLGLTQPVTSTGASVTLNAGNNLSIGAGVTANQNIVGTAGVDFNNTQPLTSTNGSATITAGSNVNVGANISALGGNITLTTGLDDPTAITLSAGTLLTASGGQISNQVLAIDINGRFTALDRSDNTGLPFVGSEGTGEILVDVRDPDGQNFVIRIDWRGGGPTALFPSNPLTDRFISSLIQGSSLATTNNALQFQHNYSRQLPPIPAFVSGGFIHVLVNISAFAQNSIVLQVTNINNETQSILALDANEQGGIQTIVDIPFASVIGSVDAIPAPEPLPVNRSAPPLLGGNVESAARPVEAPTMVLQAATATVAAEAEVRYYELRVVIFDENGRLVDDPNPASRIRLDNDEFRAIYPFDLSKLPELFRRLPADRYRLYLIEDGVERLILEFTIQQGQPVEASEMGEEKPLDQPREDPSSEDAKDAPHFQGQSSPMRGHRQFQASFGPSEKEKTEGVLSHSVQSGSTQAIIHPADTFAERLASAQFFVHGSVVIGAAALATRRASRWEEVADRRMERFGLRESFRRRQRGLLTTVNRTDTLPDADPQRTT